MDTKNNEEPIKRSHPAHFPPVDKFNRTIIVFVTVCSKSREKIFMKNDVHSIVMNAWAENKEWAVGRYVLMPDHIHLFCAPSEVFQFPLKKWVKKWKSHASRNWPRPEEHPIWQVDYWDRQLRKGESYQEKWNYVRNNPVRQGLGDNPDEWPYQGYMNLLEWHD